MMKIKQLSVFLENKPGQLSIPCKALADAKVNIVTLARLHGSSGATGKPTIVAYTAEDLDNRANLCARFLAAGGLRPERLAHIAFGYGLFTGGFGLQAFNNYGLSEVLGPGVSGECCRRAGMHLQEDRFLVECLDPDPLEPVPAGAAVKAGNRCLAPSKIQPEPV